MSSFLKGFMADECGGVATVDWLVLLSGLTLSGLTLMDVLGNAMEEQSQQVRSELQSVHFDTTWLDNAGGTGASPSNGASGTPGPSGGWSYQSGGSNTSDDTDDDGASESASLPGASQGNGRGGPNGNNGHGNDADGNDDSNPGASNSADDHDDQDGTPGGNAKHEDGDGDGKYWREGDAAAGSPDAGDAGPVVASSNVQGCPSNDYIAEPMAVTGEALSDRGIEIEHMSIGGATTNVNQCDGVPGNRFFYANPTVTLDLSELDDFDSLTVGLESDACKLALLVQDATGAFHFQNGRNRDSVEIELSRMRDLEGRVNVWVGTGPNQTCGDGALEIELDD